MKNRLMNGFLSRRAGWTILLLCCLTMVLPGKQALIEVKASVNKSVVYIGDRIVYTLTVRHDKGLEVKKPDQSVELGGFEIKEYRIRESKEENGRMVERFDYVIVGFETGRQVIPALSIRFRDENAGGDAYQSIQSESIEIDVKSLLTDGGKDIRDVKAPLEMPNDGWIPFLIIGISVILLLLFIGRYWFFKSRKETKPVYRKEVIRPAHETALEALLELLGRDLLTKGKYKTFYSSLSDILRRYIKGRYYVESLEETTEELLQSLQTVNITQEDISRVREILEQADLVKFAKYIPDKKAADGIIEQVKQFIQKTRLEFAKTEVLRETVTHSNTTVS